VSPRDGWDILEKRLSTLPGTEQRRNFHPIASRCTDYATPFHVRH